MRRAFQWATNLFRRRSRFVFLSYPRTDFVLAALLHRCLVEAHVPVYWDTRLEPGEVFDPSLREQLNNASVILALWTPGAFDRIWIRNEADVGLRYHKLVPLLYRLRPQDVPAKYSVVQAMNISDWDSSPAHPKFAQIIDAIRKTAKRAEERSLQRPLKTTTIQKGARATIIVKPGDAVRDDNCPELVVVPPAVESFMLGSQSSEPGVDQHHDISKNELPETFIAVKTPILVGKHPVTYEEWDWANSQKRGPIHSPPARWGRGKLPVTNVSWYDAQRYVDFISKYTGLRYRLLAEAEWEYTCRAGTRGPFAFNQMNLEVTRYDARGVCAGSRRKLGLNPGEMGPIQVTSCLPNDFRVCGMHGNVWEWVRDHWHDSYKEFPHNNVAMAWTDDPANKKLRRVIRGGCYKSLPQNIRSATRASRHPHTRNITIGFRIAREI